jgi:hypothetical protein
MGYVIADVRVGGRFDIGADGAAANPRFIVHRRLVDEATGADMPDAAAFGGVREMEVAADPAAFDALFSTSVAALEADNRARHEQVARLQDEKAAAERAQTELVQANSVALK